MIFAVKPLAVYSVMLVIAAAVFMQHPLSLVVTMVVAQPLNPRFTPLPNINQQTPSCQTPRHHPTIQIPRPKSNPSNSTQNTMPTLQAAATEGARRMRCLLVP